MICACAGESGYNRYTGRCSGRDVGRNHAATWRFLLSTYTLILAGGGGTRLWPHSRLEHPKQFVDLFGERSLFQLTYDRIVPLTPP